MQHFQASVEREDKTKKQMTLDENKNDIETQKKANQPIVLPFLIPTLFCIVTRAWSVMHGEILNDIP